MPEGKYVHVSGNSQVPVLQLVCYASSHSEYCQNISVSTTLICIVTLDGFDCENEL